MRTFPGRFSLATLVVGALPLGACAGIDSRVDPTVSSEAEALLQPQCDDVCTPASSCSRPCFEDNFRTTCINTSCAHTADGDLDAEIASRGYTGCSVDHTLVINGVTGKYRACTQGWVVWSPSPFTNGAYAIPNGFILAAWQTFTAVQADMGFPQGEAGTNFVSTLSFPYQVFEHGYMTVTSEGNWSAEIGNSSIPVNQNNALVNAWRALVDHYWNIPSDSTNLPQHNSGGWYMQFANDPLLPHAPGFLTVQTGGGAAFLIRDPIVQGWLALGGFSGPGYPLGNMFCPESPCWRYAQVFEHNIIYSDHL